MPRHGQPQIVEDVQAELATSQAFALKATAAVLGSIRRAIVRGDVVRVPRFGTFEAVAVRAHRTRVPPGNHTQAGPRPAASCFVAAHRRLYFRRSETLKRDLKREQ